jgi:hypothetical protein
VTTPTSGVTEPLMWSKSGSASMAMDCPFDATNTTLVCTMTGVQFVADADQNIVLYFVPRTQTVGA